MDRNDFLRKALTTFIIPTKTAYNVSIGEAKHILENLIGIYVPRDEILSLMTDEGFIYRDAGVYTGHFRANYRCLPATLLNHHWSREYILSTYPRREYERWDDVNDAIVVLKHMFANSHGRHDESVDRVVQDILGQSNNAESDPNPI